MASKDKKPQFWINPNTRLCCPHFSIVWNKCDKEELLDLCFIPAIRKKTYHTRSICLHIHNKPDWSGLHIFYSQDIDFENLRLQKWLRETIRDAVTERAKIVLPKRLHELEKEKQLYAKSVTVKKLRKGCLGQCSIYNQIWLSPLLVIFPQEMMDDVILHEMAHLKHHHHRKPFWDFLSTLIGMDARQQKVIFEAVLSKYWELYVYLMK